MKSFLRYFSGAERKLLRNCPAPEKSIFSLIGGYVFLIIIFSLVLSIYSIGELTDWSEPIEFVGLSILWVFMVYISQVFIVSSKRKAKNKSLLYTARTLVSLMISIGLSAMTFIVTDSFDLIVGVVLLIIFFILQFIPLIMRYSLETKAYDEVVRTIEMKAVETEKVQQQANTQMISSPNYLKRMEFKQAEILKMQEFEETDGAIKAIDKVNEFMNKIFEKEKIVIKDIEKRSVEISKNKDDATRIRQEKLLEKLIAQSYRQIDESVETFSKIFQIKPKD